MKMTKEMLSMTEDQLRNLLNERAVIDWTEKVENSTIAYIDLVNKRQGEIDRLLNLEKERITEEVGGIYDEDIQTAKEKVAVVKKEAAEAGV